MSSKETAKASPEAKMPPPGWYGVYSGLVVGVRDPDRQGRIKVRLPWVMDAGEDPYEAWARLATLMAGDHRGSWFIPEVDDEVLLAFEGGDPSRPYILGALWNGRDTPPAEMDDASKNELKVLRSRNGLQITLLDQDGHERLELETPGGQQITLKDGPGEIEIQDSNGNRILLSPAGIEVDASASVKVNATYVQISAAMVRVDSGLSRFSGVVQCDTLITNSVISSSYTPGAGNIW
jgi:uncharacterized protein involved in type VI secretion and phage assembly